MTMQTPQVDPYLVNLVTQLQAMQTAVSEIKDRTRRTETRLTTFLNAQGHDTKVTRPRFDYTTVSLYAASPESSVRELLEAIPLDMRENEVAIRLGGEVIGYLRRI
jgi:muconolactone delta-isomerase